MNHKCVFIRKILVGILVLCLITLITLVSINIYVVRSVSNYIYSDVDELKQNIDANSCDCILVLGCGVVNSQPSIMLEDRLKSALRLYNDGVAPKLLLSGDHGEVDYDEVNVMRDYMISNGIPSEDIFMDHAGFSTYESMMRAKNIFGCNKIIVVTQEYHLYRSLYDSRAIGITSYGYIADGHVFTQQSYYSLREYLARFKDFFLTKINPRSAYVGGDKINIHGDGNVTKG